MVMMPFFDNIYLFVTGLGLGLLISAPVGPVNILCIQHSLARGFWAGFAIGFGALLADVFIAAMAALGLTFISGGIHAHQSLIEFIGGFVLIGFGLRLYMSHPQMLEPSDQSLSPFRHLGALPQSFLLTVTNPGAILGIFAVIGSAGTVVGGLHSYGAVFYLLAGLLLGGACWWACLSWLVSQLRSKMTEKRLERINQIAGVILGLCGAGLVLKALWAIGQSSAAVA